MSKEFTENDLMNVLRRWKEARDCPPEFRAQKLRESLNDVPELVAALRTKNGDRALKHLLVLEM